MELLISAFKLFRCVLCVAGGYMFLQNLVYLDYIFYEKKRGKSLEKSAGKFFSTKKGIIVCELILLTSILLLPFIFQNFQNTDIGSFLEQESYREKYYVYIREDNTRAKAYKVKADIARNYLKQGDNFSFGDESLSLTETGYYVERIYWGNGGFLTFIESFEDYASDTEDFFSSQRIHPGNEVKVVDIKGDEYYVTLTTEKVK